MDVCEETKVSRWSMKQEIIDDLENYDEVTDDNIREICDSLVPVYNAELIDMWRRNLQFHFGFLIWLTNKVI